MFRDYLLLQFVDKYTNKGRRMEEPLLTQVYKTS